MHSLRFLTILSFAVTAAGCAIHPLPEDVTGYSTVDIVEKIRCEAKAAVNKHIPSRDYPTGGIGFDFTFTITENNNASGAAKFSLPFSKGKYSLDLGIGENKQRQTERKLIVVDTFRGLRNVDNCQSEISQPHWRYPITGSIGLNEVVNTFAKLEKTSSELESFTDTLVFTTKINGSVSPKVELNPITDKFRLTEASASLVADRQDVHKVTITLRAKPAKPKALLTEERDVRQGIINDLYRQRNLDNTDKILDILRGR